LIVRSIIKVSVVILLVLTLGLHWALLQTIAWTGMVVAYSADSSFRLGVVKTFDGKHPCPLCKIIKQGRTEEKKRQQERQVDPTLKLDLAPFLAATELVNICVFPHISAQTGCAPPRSDPPPKPHPRSPLLSVVA
jgi:hypothetical protein